jgi:hypothetical protein
MSDKAVLAAFFVATIGVAAGSAWAASDQTPAPSHPAVVKDFGKLSTDSTKGFQDVALARLAIFDGDTGKAKNDVDEAAALFEKAKSDESVFLKAESQLMTADQMKQASKESKPQESQAQNDSQGKASASMQGQVAWLPVDAAYSLDEDYTINPAKKQAVADANNSLAKGDRKGALEKLKLADVSASVVLEVVPRDAALADIKQAQQLIDAGKYYEGSQMLRKLQTAARFDITEVSGQPASGGTSHS